MDPVSWQVISFSVDVPLRTYRTYRTPGRIHPDIRELCDAFYVEERHVEKLNELMKDGVPRCRSGAVVILKPGVTVD